LQYVLGIECPTPDMIPVIKTGNCLLIPAAMEVFHNHIWDVLDRYMLEKASIKKVCVLACNEWRARAKPNIEQAHRGYYIAVHCHVCTDYESTRVIQGRHSASCII